MDKNRAAAFCLTLTILGSSCTREGAPSGIKVIEVGAVATPEDVPDAVRTTLSRATQNHPMTTLVKSRVRGKIAYETTTVIGTTSFFIRVAEDGKLLERRHLDVTPPSRPSP